MPGDKAIPRRVGSFFFKPHEETVWPAPDAEEPIRPDVLRSFVTAYKNLVTHPCGMEMLREVRREWKRLAKREHEEVARG